LQKSFINQNKFFNTFEYFKAQIMKFENYQTSNSLLNSRIKEITSAGVKNDRNKLLKHILGLVDLTTLEGADTNEKVIALCEKAKGFKDKSRGVPDVAAVCVYPVFVRLVKYQLKGSDIKTASVAGAFPSGQSPLSVKLMEVQYAVDQGADEIDMVISRGKFLQGEYNEVFDEIASIRDVCKNVLLKVILETGELQTIENIRKASEIAINAGADFIKTSTGKIQPAATELAVLVMLDTINEYYEKNSKKIGVKAAGGISSPDQAINYYQLVSKTLGDQWIDKEYFRIGASSLTDNITKMI